MATTSANGAHHQHYRPYYDHLTDNTVGDYLLSPTMSSSDYSTIADAVETECLEHYETNLEKHKGRYKMTTSCLIFKENITYHPDTIPSLSLSLFHHHFVGFTQLHVGAISCIIHVCCCCIVPSCVICVTIIDISSTNHHDMEAYESNRLLKIGIIQTFVTH